MTTEDEADRRARADRARETGLFRYSLVQELLEPGLSAAERGWRARELAGRVHEGPGGRQVTVSYATLGRWRRAYAEGGFDALVPSPRQPSPRTPDEVLALAEALKREKPGRTAAQVRRVLQRTTGWAPSERTLQRLFERLELGRPEPGPDEAGMRALSRFECDRPNQMWVGDTLHGPLVGGKKAYLFALIDDHSRAVMGARWAYSDDVVRMAAAFRPALQARGVPSRAYFDNGSPFIDGWLLRGCAVLGVRLVHSRPGMPEGRGKIERFFRTVRDQFLVEVADNQVSDLAEMNRLFQAWLEASYHVTVHSETGQAPRERWEKATPEERAVPEPSLLREAFLWSVRRKVDKTGLVRMETNAYQVDAWLAGQYVELIFDPFDLSRIEVRKNGRPAGTAVPFTIRRHSHPKTGKDDGRPRAEPEPTGIDYLALLGDAHDAALRDQVSYRSLISPSGRQQDQREEGEDRD
jgi:putative transposase